MAVIRLKYDDNMNMIDQIIKKSQKNNYKINTQLFFKIKIIQIFFKEKPLEEVKSQTNLKITD